MTKANTKFIQNKALALEVNGEKIQIRSGSRWLVFDNAEYTQVGLDMPGHELDGLTVCLDFSQPTYSRPEKKSDRIAMIFSDIDLLSQHAENHLTS